VNARRYADAAGLGQRFEPRRDIAPSPDVAILDDDITLMDADAVFDAAVGRERRI